LSPPYNFHAFIILDFKNRLTPDFYLGILFRDSPGMKKPLLEAMLAHNLI
jgi:hypothetical protein